MSIDSKAYSKSSNSAIVIDINLQFQTEITNHNPSIGVTHSSMSNNQPSIPNHLLTHKTCLSSIYQHKSEAFNPNRFKPLAFDHNIKSSVSVSNNRHYVSPNLWPRHQHPLHYKDFGSSSKLLTPNKIAFSSNYNQHYTVKSKSNRSIITQTKLKELQST